MMDKVNPLNISLNQGNYEENSFCAVSEGNSKGVGPKNIFENRQQYLK